MSDSFLYEIETLNKSTGEYNNIGTRKTNVYQEDQISGKNYYLCNEIYDVLGNNNTTESRFYLTTNSIEFYADSSGVSALIPDSIEIEIKLNLDEYFRIVTFPLVKNEEWITFILRSHSTIKSIKSTK